MTIIVYNHKDGQIAVDSRLTSDGIICSDEFSKVIINELGAWVVSGRSDDYEILTKLTIGDNIGRELNCTAMLIREGHVFLVLTENEAICNKVPYESKKQAKKSIKGFKKNYFKGKARFYRCQKCHKWHLTTMPKSKARILTSTLRKLGIKSGQVYENEHGETIEIIEAPKTLEGIGLFLLDFKLTNTD